MRTIEMKCGIWATLDDEDWERLSGYDWKLSKSGYAYRVEKVDGKRKTIWMHREVMEHELSWRKGRWEVHHWDENKLNNQRHNLLVGDKYWHSHQHRGRPAKVFRICGTLQSQSRRTF